jgi:hypothetical protein
MNRFEAQAAVGSPRVRCQSEGPREAVPLNRM